MKPSKQVSMFGLFQAETQSTLLNSSEIQSYLLEKGYTEH